MPPATPVHQNKAPTTPPVHQKRGMPCKTPRNKATTPTHVPTSLARPLTREEVCAQAFFQVDIFNQVLHCALLGIGHRQGCQQVTSLEVIIRMEDTQSSEDFDDYFLDGCVANTREEDNFGSSQPRGKQLHISMLPPVPRSHGQSSCMDSKS